MQNQIDLFNLTTIYKDEPAISGLLYLPNFITQQEHQMLLTNIDNSQWLTDLKRRVQHYGYKYDYKKRNIDISMKINCLPEWMQFISNKLYSEGLVKTLPNQVIVNEYLPGQGIAPHIDCEPCFESSIASLSLGSACIMDLYLKSNQEIKIKKLLEPRSLIILQDEARYEWFHGIKANKTFNYNGKKIQRERRVSLTFRTVILS